MMIKSGEKKTNECDWEDYILESQIRWIKNESKNGTQEEAAEVNKF